MKTRSIIIIGIIVILAVSTIYVSLVYNQEIKISLGMMQSDEKPEPLHISGYKIETVAENLTIPWSIDWLPDGTALFTERNGNLRAIQNGELIQEPLLTLGVGAGEGG